jgi:hypothetical protein
MERRSASLSEPALPLRSMFPMMTLRSPTEHDPWSLAEAVDLPLALEEERFSPEREKNRARDREEIAREVGHSGKEGVNDQAVLRAWLRRWRRKAAGDTPGEWIEDVLRNAGRIAMAAGLLLGLAAASDRLFFTAPEPLNVFFLVGVFVLLPLLVSATLLLTVALRKPGQGNFLQQFFVFVARKLTRAGHAWSAGDSLRPDASWKTITNSLGKNRELLQAPVLAVSQKLALGFGIGLLIMLQLRVSFWELAFGWQTTLTAPGDLWHLVTRAIAAPWSWFWPEGSPSIEQINATRYSRLPGAAPIDAGASRAWWPFLFATILVWSVLLRGAVLGGLRVLQRRRLRAFDPLSPDAQLLVRRLRPHWSVNGADAPMSVPGAAATSAMQRPFQQGAWIALVADEPDATMPRGEDVPRLLGVTPEKTIPFQFDDSAGEKTLAALEQLQESAGPALILVPVSRDPIDEVCDTLRAIATAGRAGGTLVLCGAPDRLALWKRKLDGWGIGLTAEYLPRP